MSNLPEENITTNLTVDDWEEQFHPRINHIDPNASFGGDDGGFMFETYGDELAFVAAQDEHYVWTYVEASGPTYIVNGRRFVDRIGYFVTTVPWRKEYEILVNSEEDFE
jgi:hypothetical protein